MNQISYFHLQPDGKPNMIQPFGLTRSEERRVERVLPVGGHDDLDVGGLVESVHLCSAFRLETTFLQSFISKFNEHSSH